MPRAPKASAHPLPSPASSGSEAAVDKTATIEGIAQDIATAIVEKRLPPGTWLREEALGRLYSVSRTKIRAALLTLSKEKLIEMIPDKGAFVSKPSVQEAREVFGVRRLLESEVVRLFVAKARPADYQALEQHIQFERTTLRATTTTGTVREKLLGDFHVALAEAAGNQTLAELIRELVARSSLIAMLYHSSNDPHCSSDEHAEFLRVCRSGDAEAAVACMTDHLLRIEANLQLSAGVPDRQLDLVKALLA
ncbi:GntR family transcriptional regulator [Variovorax saccharolyticus]|uniref:GntR family transcriptional regulator n=1 Tax=Variovorax saccharolyticus TaxID=3053516 RepID=UPI002575C0D5|nr:GntR family transcriptional regulator [Variovorax sp. J31P216]MDM0024478.1 GntR family transcriptional regulator [Variovorax sp. J31P216]